MSETPTKLTDICKHMEYSAHCQICRLETELAAALAAKEWAEEAERSLSEQVKAMDAALADAERDAARFRSLVDLMVDKQAGALHINQWLVMSLSKNGRHYEYHSDPPSGSVAKAESVLAALRNAIDAAMGAKEPRP